MNKTEYIKILRDNQNIIKEIIRDYKSFNEDNPLPSNDEFLITKKQHLIIAMVNLIFIVLTYKKEEFDLFSTAAFFLFLVEICIYFASDKVQNELIEITNKDLEFIKTCTLQNQKIENVIEFFKDTSEEEVQKYLSYKMGDSKKIN